MSKHQDSANKALYEQQESQLSAQSSAFINLLTKRGILEDREIDNDRIRQAQKEKKRNMYHNTLLLLQHYRNIVWALECFPATVAEELDHPLGDLDALLDRMDLESASWRAAWRACANQDCCWIGSMRRSVFSNENRKTVRRCTS